MVHRGMVKRDQAVRCINGKVIEPVLHPDVISVSGDHKSLKLDLRKKIDFAALKTVEGREDLQVQALAVVLTIMNDPTASDADRLKAAGRFLPKEDGWVLASLSEMQDDRDLDEEIFEITEQLRDEYLARAKELNNTDILELLSPKARTIVLTELAEHGLHWGGGDEETVDESEAV